MRRVRSSLVKTLALCGLQADVDVVVSHTGPNVSFRRGNGPNAANAVNASPGSLFPGSQSRLRPLIGSRDQGVDTRGGPAKRRGSVIWTSSFGEPFVCCRMKRLEEAGPWFYIGKNSIHSRYLSGIIHVRDEMKVELRQLPSQAGLGKYLRLVLPVCLTLENAPSLAVPSPNRAQDEHPTPWVNLDC